MFFHKFGWPVEECQWFVLCLLFGQLLSMVKPDVCTRVSFGLLKYSPKNHQFC